MVRAEYIIMEGTPCPKPIIFVKSLLWIHQRGISLNLFFPPALFAAYAFFKRLHFTREFFFFFFLPDLKSFLPGPECILCLRAPS